MKIQHRTLLSALIPVPALLFLGYSLRQDSTAAVNTARAVKSALQIVAAADALADDLKDERRAAAENLAAGEITLDTLMVAQDSAADVLSSKSPEQLAELLASTERSSTLHARELTARLGTAEDARTLTQFSTSADALSRVLGRIPQQREAMRQATTLKNLLLPFEDPIRRTGDLHDRLALSVDDAVVSNLTAARATLSRLRTLAEDESLAVYFILISRTLSSGQSRLVAELEGQLQWQRRQFHQVFADALENESLQAAWQRSDAEGRSIVIKAVLSQDQRLDGMAAMLRVIGYGGLIQHYKNYQLRRESKYLELFQRDYSVLRATLEQLGAQADLSERERQDFATVQTTFAAYASSIDSTVTIDDSAALEALGRLTVFDPPVTTTAWRKQWLGFVDALKQLDARMADAQAQRVAEIESSAEQKLLLSTLLVLTTMLLSLLAAGTLAIGLARGFAKLVVEFQRIAATGDLGSTLRPGGRDELTDLHSAVMAINARIARVAEAAARMALGDYRSDPELLGPKDQLALAVREMGAAARGVISQAEHIARGDYDVQVTPRGEADDLSRALVGMTVALRSFVRDSRRTEWQSRGRLALFETLRGQPTPQVLAERMLGFLAGYVNASVGLMYLHERDHLVLYGRYAVPDSPSLPQLIKPGDGQVGQAFLAGEMSLIQPLPEDYLRVQSGTGAAPVRHLLLLPLRVGSDSVGVLELGFLNAPEEQALELLRSTAESMAVAIAAISRNQTERLLSETRLQAEQLESQQEQLRAANEELEEQTQMLRQSEEELKSQREELRTVNEELQEKGSLLGRQKRDLERTASELEQATRYKSEFLANMSHELRTPLNSLLILAQQLAANESGNLTAEQTHAARVIHEGGRDLLNLINDILDLSKVEAGRLDFHMDAFGLSGLLGGLREHFEPVAQQRKLSLHLECAADAPKQMVSDRQRVQQILRNLLSNALKFTSRGQVSLHIGRPASDMPLRRAGLQHDTAIAFAVRDTGIGIPFDKLERIFEAFTQADGTTSRRYGGTGLGLTICRQLTGPLGGEIHVESVPNEGSVFTLVLPEKADASAAPLAATPVELVPPPLPITPPPEVAPIEDDRLDLLPGGRSLLIIEDDLRFAAVVRDMARARGYRCLVADTAASGLRLARLHLPTAVVLDLKLPDGNGLTVLEALKQSPGTRHIPVHIMSASARSTEPLAHGAIGFISKPASQADVIKALDQMAALSSRSQRNVLVIEADPSAASALGKLLENRHTRILHAADAGQAQATLAANLVDCIVLDLSEPDHDGLDFLCGLKADDAETHPPVVVYSARQLSGRERAELDELAHSLIIKDAASPEHLLDETTLFLHMLESSLDEPQRQAIARLHTSPDVFKGRKLLLVDDDLRNTFALSGVLKGKGFEVLIADNGQLALERLDEQPDIDVVLMDIMMPVMDGFEAMRQIRAQARFKSLPVLALTAKAMAEDRRKCMEAGATDYLTKPVDLEQLLAALRLWLSRTG